MTASDRLVMRRPDDWHVHLRDGAMLRAVLPATARTFARAVVMPNLRPPVTSVDEAIAYRARILEALPEGLRFEPLMTAYLTDAIDPEELDRGFRQGVFSAAKLYPANATTNSAAGVSDISKISGVLERMEAIDMPLLIHGEVTDPDVDVFDREALFIQRHLLPLRERHPRLRIILEHITTDEAVTYIREAYLDGDERIAATITPHHLHLNRNAMFVGGLRSDYYCLPVVKRECHRRALVRAATSGHPCFFLGTDSAPHPRSGKESACGCAGIFNAFYALESYAAVFEQEGALDRLEAFASEFGPRFYGLPLNTDTIALVRQPQIVPHQLSLPQGGLVDLDVGEVPFFFHGGETLSWSLESIGQD